MDDELLRSTRKFLEELEKALKNIHCSKELKPVIAKIVAIGRNFQPIGLHWVYMTI